MVGYKERMEIGYGIEKELCFHPDPRVLFSPSVKNQLGKGWRKGTMFTGRGYITLGALWSSGR